MASIQANGSKGHHKFILTVTEGAISIPNNTSPVSYKFQIAPVQTSWNWEQWGAYIKYSFKINGVEYTGSIDAYDGYSTVTLKSGTQTVTHNADGSKSISYSFSVTDTSGVTYTSGNASASGTLALTKIPRYATVNQSLKSRTETTIVMNWSSDNTVDYIWYSKDNGSTWSGLDVADGKSGSYTISGLTANTKYNIKTRVRRKDSQLTTDSSALSVTTYAYPYCTETPDYTLGENLTIKFFNPLSRSITWQLGIGEGTVIASGTSSGTSASVTIGATGIDKMYASIPNAKQGLYYVKVIYDGKGFVKSGGKFYITGMELPSIQSVTYYDSNSSTVAITGNNQHIVQNKSNLKVQVAEALTTFGAGSIEQYTLTYNGKVKIGSQAGTFDLGVIDSSKNISIELQVRDSRGLIAKKSFTVTMLAHSTPNATVTLERLNNYEDETYLTIDGSISSVNSKNTMAIKYRYKKSGGSYGSYATTTDKQKNTLSLDKNNSYIFEVVVTDAFGSTFTKEYVLNKGVFPLFIDTVKNSVGINCFPENENSLEVDGGIYANSLKCKNLLYTPYTESNKFTHTATRDDHAVVTGYYCYLEKDKKYTFSCKTDGAWGGGNATDTVEIFLLKDKAYDVYVQVVGNPKTFTATASGVYFLRCDVNKNETTHSFWDFQIEEGSVATEYVEAKQFEYQDRYTLGEHKVGFWIDGKPLYRQIVSLGASHFGTTETTTGKNLEIAHNVKNIKDIVKMEDVWCTNSQYRKFPSNYYGNAGWDGHYYCTNTNICFELGSAIYNRLIFSTTFLYIVLYYTKTTD